MWHMTCDIWHMTCDTCCGRWTFSQNFSSLASTVCDLWYLEDFEEKADWINQSRWCLKNIPGYTRSAKIVQPWGTWKDIQLYTLISIYIFLDFRQFSNLVIFQWILITQLAPTNFYFNHKGLLCPWPVNLPYQSSNVWRSTTTCWVMQRNWNFGFRFRGLYLTLIRTGPVKIPPKCHLKSSLVLHPPSFSTLSLSSRKVMQRSLTLVSIKTKAS